MTRYPPLYIYIHLAYDAGRCCCVTQRVLRICGVRTKFCNPQAVIPDW